MKGWKRCQGCRKKLKDDYWKVNGYLLCSNCKGNYSIDLSHAVQHFTPEEKEAALKHSRALLFDESEPMGDAKQ